MYVFIIIITKPLYFVKNIHCSSTDFLMISGIGSLKLGIVVKYAVPLLVVCLAGFLINWLWFPLCQGDYRARQTMIDGVIGKLLVKVATFVVIPGLRVPDGFPSLGGDRQVGVEPLLRLNIYVCGVIQRPM